MSIVERERVEEVVAPREVTKADVLERAADLLEEFGWQQGYYGSKFEGKMCAVGAIVEAGRDCGVSDINGVRRACGIMGYPRGIELWPLAAWNDEPGRTKAEVVAALRTAAKEART